MHEVSLMKNLLEIVENTARRESGGKVNRIHLRVGEMSGVNIDALKFAFEVLSRGTAAEGGALECETVPLVIRCRRCGTESSAHDFVFSCAACGSPDIDLVSGREMEIDYIMVDNGGGADSGNRSS